MGPGSGVETQTQPVERPKPEVAPATMGVGGSEAAPGLLNP
jgi:hypothetical protein